MTASKLWIIAYRDLLRNRRRSLLTLLAVALGLALLIMVNGLIAGMVNDSLQNSIRLRTGHIQLRAATYEEEKMSLHWQDLLENPDDLVAGIKGRSEVQAAAPVLWAGGILSTRDDAINLPIFGIDPTSPLYAPIQESLVAGRFLLPDDRDGLMIGQRLADSLGVGVGQKVNLALVNANGDADNANFTLVGLFSTGIVSYDQSAIFIPLSKAQVFAGVGERASAIVILLHEQADAERVAATLQTPQVSTLTWREANAFFLQTMETSMSFYIVIDGIIMLIVAVIIANTLLMAVFERIREIGILAALGMKSRQIMTLFLFESFILGLAGVVVGFGLGSLLVFYLSQVGIPLGASSASAAGNNFALSSTMYAQFVPDTFLWLSAWTLAFVVLASLYPARYAAQQEPVVALHSGSGFS